MEVQTISVARTAFNSFTGTVCNITAKVAKFFRNCYKTIVFSPSERKADYIYKRLTLINQDQNVHNKAQDKFLHIVSSKKQLSVLKAIQNHTNIDHSHVKAYFDLLRVDTKQHLKFHIWEANNKSDDNLGDNYADSVINTDMKSPLISQAINKCLSE